MSKLSRRRLLQATGAAGWLAAVHAKTAGARAAKSSNRASDSNPGRRTASGSAPWDPTNVGMPFMKDPVWVYDNWSAYTDGIYEEKVFGGVEDKTRLNEELSM